MENMITVFENEEFGAVRTATINGEPWFVANDVFRVLSVRNTKDALHTLDEDEKSGVDIIDPHGRIQRTNCISESGLYSIVLRSRKPEAKAFRRWITHEVIPAIRKHGMYATTPMLRQFQENPELIRLVCERMLAEKDRADKLDKKVTELQPKADFFDAFVNPDDCTNIRTTAKELGIPERAFCRFLQDAGFLYRCPAGNLLPYNRPENEGLFIVRDFYSQYGHHGTYTLITSMGKNLLRELLIPERKDA